MGSRSEGLIKVNLANLTFENASAIGSNYAIKSPFVLSFFTNSQKITWVGLSGGIAKYDNNKIQFGLWRNEPIPGKKITDNKLFSLFSDDAENFYAGTLYGGLLLINTLKNTYTYYMPLSITGNSSLDAKNIYQITSGEENVLWMATWDGVYSFNKYSKRFTRYKDAADDQTSQLCGLIKLKLENKILTGGYKGGLRLLDVQTKKWQLCKSTDNAINNTTLNVRYLKEFEGGDVYLATEQQNLVRYNYITGKTEFYPQLKKISGTSRHFCFNKQFLWIATDDGLIQVLAKSMEVVKVWNTTNGLPNDIIYAVLPDKFDNIWISSNRGLTRLNLITNTTQNFTDKDGLQDLEFNTASCFADYKGRLWFGGVNGLNMIDPVLIVNNEYSPPPIFTNIDVMNTPYITDTAVPYISNITLPNSKNFVGFGFQSPNYSQSEKTTYKYMLTGVDTGWVNNGTRTYVSYTQLKPGRYTFKVLSANANDVWSKKCAEINIYIVPPWYKTWWFYLVLALFLGITSIIIINGRIKSIHYKAAIKNHISETEMAALKAQMNPHFMFNCINSIDAFIKTNDKYNATLYLNKFAKLIRNVLDSSKQNVVPFSKDIDTLKLYVELEELRSENKFKVQMHVDEELLNNDYKVPPLIIQPFVENAIIHGLRNKPGNNGLLNITIGKTAEHIVYTITDNGIGRQAAEKINTGKEKSYGLEMSYDRIKLFNKETEPSVTIKDLYTDGNAAGTQVIMKLNKV